MYPTLGVRPTPGYSTFHSPHTGYSVTRVPHNTGMSGTETNPVYAVYSLLSLAGATTGAYHGYKRNNSVGWAIGWFLLGGMFPFITIPVSLAQGYGKPAK